MLQKSLSRAGVSEWFSEGREGTEDDQCPGRRVSEINSVNSDQNADL